MLLSLPLSCENARFALHRQTSRVSMVHVRIKRGSKLKMED